MKIIDVAVKDLNRVFHSVFSLIMMFGAPLLIAGLLYFAFGGLTGADGSYALSTTRVVVANLDQAHPSTGDLNAGKMLIEFLQNEDLGDVIALSLISNETEARSAVENQEADVALIIPAYFTQAAMTPGQEAAIVLYQDPTLTIGPGIVKDLVNHFIDGFSGAKIASSVTAETLQEVGATPSPDTGRTAAIQYAAYLEDSGHAALLRTVDPSGENQPADPGAAMIGPIMASMMIFFVFFMGANGAESIIREDEEGTLARLFTTPTARITILAGKFVGIFATLVIQTAVLLVVSALIFNISWGSPFSVVLITLGLIFAATGFGVLLMSFIKNTRQTGPILGGALTITGMLGGLFTNGVPNIPEAMDRISLILPQGWALRAWKLSLAGASSGAILVPVLVMTAVGALFFSIGLSLFRKRFN